MRWLDSLQPLGLVVLRLALGLIFFTHGYPKLTRATAPVEAMFVQHGLPAKLVYVAGVLETFGGILVVIGLFTRPAALLLAIEMAVAIVKVHGAHGILALHEYEFPLALGAAALALATCGAGALSADRLLFEAGATRARAARAAKKER
jgi:putative oxidoreductase